MEHCLLQRFFRCSCAAVLHSLKIIWCYLFLYFLSFTCLLFCFIILILSAVFFCFCFSEAHWTASLWIQWHCTNDNLALALVSPRLRCRQGSIRGPQGRHQWRASRCWTSWTRVSGTAPLPPSCPSPPALAASSATWTACRADPALALTTMHIPRVRLFLVKKQNNCISVALTFSLQLTVKT